MTTDDLGEAIDVAQDDLDAAIKQSLPQGFLTIEQRLLFSISGAVIALARELHELRDELAQRAEAERQQQGESMWIGSMPPAPKEPAMNVCPLCGGTREGVSPCSHSFHMGEPATSSPPIQDL